ncbi:MAG: hypothetical protein DRJ64_06150 [Thermoprotei archaeon]|nr:MAG: hypothetical protein DRJ64_06150 [Thermoprotei archaeon]
MTINIKYNNIKQKSNQKYFNYFENMQTAIFKPQILVFPDVRINYQFPAVEQKDEITSDLFKPLTEKGLDRLTSSKIEYIICTSALSAHI